MRDRLIHEHFTAFSVLEIWVNDIMPNKNPRHDTDVFLNDILSDNLISHAAKHCQELNAFSYNIFVVIIIKFVYNFMSR